MNRKQQLLTGILKFDDAKVSEQDLASFAEELGQDENYIVLYVRKTSNDQHGIGFSYIYNGGDREAFKEVRETLKDQMYKKFGVAFVGWDLSSSTVVVKGFPEKVLEID